MPPRAVSCAARAAVLSLGLLKPGKAQCYLDPVASGVEDYYS